MQSQHANWQQWTSMILMILLCLAFLTNVGNIRTGVQPEINVPTASEIAANVNIPVTNDTAILQAVEGVQTTLNEDDEFEDDMINLATSEWTDRDYKDIYNAIKDLFPNTIEEREDIDKVVVREEKMISSDIDDEDAVVVQDLKVYYEDNHGDNQKVYISVETEIEEGEVEDQLFVQTP